MTQDYHDKGTDIPCSHLGEKLIQELNRLGILVDLSHTSDATARQAIKLSEAPVIWSHSSARAVWDVPRNVPDDILKLIGEKKGQKDGVIMVRSPRHHCLDVSALTAAISDR